jgi:maleylpyruvate isomerase
VSTSETSRRWVDTGTTLFLDELNRLDDAALDAPTGLPGWSRRHLVAHVHFNALALCRLADWAATGLENRMYASGAQRSAEIDDGATWPAGRIRELVVQSAAGLSAALDSLTPQMWQARVVTAQGREVAAEEIPWLRAREVLVHAVDLDAGVRFDDLPADFTTALLVDIVRKRGTGGEGAALAGWLTGRSSNPPELARWL